MTENRKHSLAFDLASALGRTSLASAVLVIIAQCVDVDGAKDFAFVAVLIAVCSGILGLFLCAVGLESHPEAWGAFKSKLPPKRLLLRIVVGLYLVTWIGGTMTHWLQIRRRAIETWESMRLSEAKWLAEGKPPLPERELALPGGPQYWISYSVPLLPGVLLVSSSTDAGGRCGGGEQYLLFYYGYCSKVLGRRTTWVY